MADGKCSIGVSSLCMQSCPIGQQHQSCISKCAHAARDNAFEHGLNSLLLRTYSTALFGAPLNELSMSVPRSLMVLVTQRMHRCSVWQAGRCAHVVKE
jgi:hypothetical protein